MKDLMYDVVYNGLTDIWQPKNVKVIAKTGTAQIASPKGGYLSGEYDYVKSFAGVFPADNPKYIIYFSTQKMQTGTKNMASVITTLIDDIAQYSKFTESDNDVNYKKIISLDNYISKKTVDSVNELLKLELQPIIVGDGKYVIDHFPNKDDRLIINDKVFLKTNSTNYTMLDLSKWSMNEAKTFCDLVGISCIFNGYGTIVSQSMAKDSILDKDSVVAFELMDY
jgi:Cell division protein FtsI/penicillin-binding protein 2